MSRPAARLPRGAAILLVSMAGLLLEVGYTRIVSYKLWYYYTYLVIGLALLGMGTGAIVVVLSSRLKQASADGIVAAGSLAGAVSIAVGYLVVARLPIDTLAIWQYGTAESFVNLGALIVICFVLFSTFIALGIIVATLLGRAGDGVGRLYFADLVGAGLGCVIAVPLLAWLGAPDVVLVAALGLAGVGLLARPPQRTALAVAGAVTAGGLATALVAGSSVVPDVRPEQTKHGAADATFSEWGPVFRVDVVPVSADHALLVHDGTFGSAIRRFDGDAAALTAYDDDPRAIPFDVLGAPPARQLIIGAAGGYEILASLHFGAEAIEAVELNPVTVSLLTDHFAEFTGHLAERPGVELHGGDGRSYLARADARYDLIWFVAPDSYAATNAASAGAFVLSESYLYTTEMIEESLEHLTPDGIIVAQFGEFDFAGTPSRTSRYVVTARDALERAGVEDSGRHLIVAADSGDVYTNLSTVVVKATPFTPSEVARVVAGVDARPGARLVHAPGYPSDGGFVARLAGGSRSDVAALVASHALDISPVDDDRPFFWHFSGFGAVLGDIFEPITVVDPEHAVGERVLLLLLGMAVAYAAVFLLLPFAFVRGRGRATGATAFPGRGLASLYFAALGLGFMFFEITMIQRLVLFLGYPTYSLTVTLAGILVATGVGAVLSRRFVPRAAVVLPRVLAVLAALTVAYRFVLDDVSAATLSAPLPVRVGIALAVLAPLGLSLGMFMPLGLGLVGRLGGDAERGEQYVAWAWAVNGFASVVGSVLTTILSMTFGFGAVQLGALGLYAVAVGAFLRLHRLAAEDTVARGEAARDVATQPA